MGRIHVLDDHLTNMIAAGEVVERPASVVKELVENAIDAGATHVEVHIEDGGLQLIRIVDDGQGMDREDCQRAFERHATSKIRTTRDLFHIRTLGFRGEALPSIASVSRIDLVSSESSSQVGCRLVVEGGKVALIEDQASVKGTDIQVRDLFYNTPARLKYMKSISTEVGHVSDYVNRLALTYPAISFTFTHNGKTLLSTAGDGKLLHVIAAIYGVQVAKLLVPVEGETLDFRWTGFLSKPEVTRANRSYITTLVNGRYIRNYAINNAVMRGYHTLLPVGRYPIVVLNLEMDPTLVDVNVHPAKLEVRISKEQELCEAVESSVQKTLRAGLKILQPLQTEKQPKITLQQPVQPQLDLRLPESNNLPLTKQLSTFNIISNSGSKDKYTDLPRPGFEPRRSEWEETKKHVVREAPSDQGADTTTTSQPIMDTVENPSDDAIQHQVDDVVSPEVEIAAEDIITSMIAGSSEGDSHKKGDIAVPLLYPVAQVHGTYIVAQNDEGMYLIDQHAAQERIFYELFMEKLAQECIASQMLLFPHTIECTTQEETKLLKRLEYLRSMGLDMEAFGNRTFIVRAHPHWFPQGSELEVIEEMIQFVLEASDSQQMDIVKMREKAAIMMACKASIKANRFLTQEEMEQLINRLRLTTSPFTCPHGRPIIIHFSTYDLEKMFKRVM